MQQRLIFNKTISPEIFYILGRIRLPINIVN